MSQFESQKWEVRDRYGNKISMTAERWAHALESRPWLAPSHTQVLAALRNGRRQQDPLNARKYKYYWPCAELLSEFNHLVVVVLFGEQTNTEGETVPNNYVTNVWAVFIYGKR
jgi:hypothetical protein